MIVDFHTHIFPEKIASKTIAALEAKANSKAFTDGTLASLKRSMADAGIDWSVVLPVVTKPSQFETVNQYAASINGKDGILSFGGIHPDTAHPTEALASIKALGLKGIKLHPDYQSCMIDDPRNVAILRCAVSMGLMVVVHAGVDIGMPEIVHCPPDKGAAVLDQLYAGQTDVTPRIVFAHTGGWHCWDDVERCLVGKPIYLDISFSLGMIPEEQLLRIIRRHGADKILFATDSPWSGQRESVQAFCALPLTDREKSLILGENAARLLQL
ncbi:MAG: amidohydrolase family protein [Oscillospiraceae bacterium]|nr:amidohydrolase family protein [Oscillospiraceae bacterium]